VVIDSELQFDLPIKWGSVIYKKLNDVDILFESISALRLRSKCAILITAGVRLLILSYNISVNEGTKVNQKENLKALSSGA
jgi:hypothetical protein